MNRKGAIAAAAGIALTVTGVSAFSGLPTDGEVFQSERITQPAAVSNFQVEILVNGRSAEEYRTRGKSYVEAQDGAEYEVRLRNPTPYGVAVALSVDGLNTIDASRTTAWNASKWVIEPYGTIIIGGWQMSTQRARRFYFTSERDSYGAKLGQTSNLGVISAVFFRERRPIVTMAPAPNPRPLYKEDRRERDGSKTTSSGGDNAAAKRRGEIAPAPDDEYAATGIGRSVQNDVRWVNMDLESKPAGEVTLRYEYYSALVRLGILPRRYIQPDPLSRRERATGFEDRRFSPEP